MTAASLHAVHIGASDLARARHAYETILGARALPGPEPLRLPVGDAMLCLSTVGVAGPGDATTSAARPGIWALGLRLHEAPARLAHWRSLYGGSGDTASHDWVDLRGVRIFASDDAAQTLAPETHVRLDHVALMVRDLQAATREWEDLTGVVAHHMPVHPVSNGTLAASRFLLGARMIELLAPIEGQASALADRLAKVGEGPLALALPAKDLDRSLARLRDQGVGVVYTDPHWVVRPGSAAGVPIQLTQRVAH